jgi:hypothetical protein
VYIYNVEKKKDDTDGHGRNIGEVRNAYNMLLRQPKKKGMKHGVEKRILK